MTMWRSSTKSDRTGTTITRLLRQAGFLLPALLLSAGVAAASPAPATLYADANAAFRSGAYAEAAELYVAADRAGYGDPALHFNLGVANYRLGRLGAAEAAFATASTDARLGPLARYNLGLVARKAREPNEARGWFQQVRGDRGASAELRALASRALESLPARQLASRPRVWREREERWTDFIRFSFDTGYGADSNVYRAPSDSYVDLAATGTPVVDPIVQSGAYVPLAAEAQIRWGPFGNGHLFVGYELDGRIFVDAGLTDANEFRNKLAIGGKSYETTDGGYRYFTSEFSAVRYDETYVDRDTGQEEIVAGTSLSGRLERTRFGPRFYYHRQRGRIGYGVRGDAYITQYHEDFDDTLSHLDLTHEQYLAGAHVSIEPLKGSDFRLSYNRYRRVYGDRKAKDVDGALFISNPELEYDYADYGLTLTQRLGSRWSTRWDYRWTDREDLFENYDDYTRHTGRGRLRYRGKRLELDVGATYRYYDFPNSFAFDLAAAGEKTLETLYGELAVEYKFRPRYSVRLAAEMDLVDSSDPRVTYDRNQVSLSLQWTL